MHLIREPVGSSNTAGKLSKIADLPEMVPQTTKERRADMMLTR